jgi:hypothetical protein
MGLTWSRRSIATGISTSRLGGGHRFVEGEYVSITEHDGQTLPFRVVSVRPHVPDGAAA